MTTILDELRLHGPMTAVTLAARLGRAPTGVDRDGVTPCEVCGTNLETATRRGDRAVTLANHAARVARLAIRQLHQHDPAMANRLGVILRTGRDPARAPRSPAGRRQQQIMDALRGGGWMTTAQLGEACGMTRTYAADVARVLHQNGVIARRTSRGRNEFRAQEEAP